MNTEEYSNLLKEFNDSDNNLIKIDNQLLLIINEFISNDKLSLCKTSYSSKEDSTKNILYNSERFVDMLTDSIVEKKLKVEDLSKVIDLREEYFKLLNERLKVNNIRYPLLDKIRYFVKKQIKQ
jgi:hypothetical protein